MAYIYFGNLTVEDIERRTGITFSEKHKEYLKEHRQERVNSTPLKEGYWHCYDLPFMFMASDETTAKKYVDMLSVYDWSECKECLRVGY